MRQIINKEKIMKKLFIIVTSGMLSMSAMSVFADECDLELTQKLFCSDKTDNLVKIFTYPTDIPKEATDSSVCDESGLLVKLLYSHCMRVGNDNMQHCEGGRHKYVYQAYINTNNDSHETKGTWHFDLPVQQGLMHCKIVK